MQVARVVNEDMKEVNGWIEIKPRIWKIGEGKFTGAEATNAFQFPFFTLMRKYALTPQQFLTCAFVYFHTEIEKKKDEKYFLQKNGPIAKKKKENS